MSVKISKSFTKTENNKGPKLDPCGTPVLQLRGMAESYYIELFVFCSLSSYA